MPFEISGYQGTTKYLKSAVSCIIWENVEFFKSINHLNEFVNSNDSLNICIFLHCLPVEKLDD